MPVNIYLQRLIDNMHVARVNEFRTAWAKRRWERRGKPSPLPALLKQEQIRAYAARYGARVLVETGTFLGDTVQAMLPHFRQIYSIELSERLFKRAKKRFSRRDKVVLLQGDSAEVLPKVLRSLGESALFWLDGHYSAGYTARGEKETPIVEELQAILGDGRPHVILIDDARLFDGTHDYPRLEEVRLLVARMRPEYSTTVADDIIKLCPPSPQ